MSKEKEGTGYPCGKESVGEKPRRVTIQDVGEMFLYTAGVGLGATASQVQIEGMSCAGAALLFGSALMMGDKIDELVCAHGDKMKKMFQHGLERADKNIHSMFASFTKAHRVVRRVVPNLQAIMNARGGKGSK